MSNAHTEPKNELCVKDVCLQIGVWGMLVVGFLAVCTWLPMLILNI